MGNQQARRANTISAFLRAAETGDAATVRALLTSPKANEHFDVEARGSNGWTALLLAAEEGHDEVVQILLRHGANPNALGKDGSNAIHHAASGGHLSTISLLSHAGCDVNAITTSPRYSPLHIAASLGKRDVVRHLLDLGASRFPPSTTPPDQMALTSEIINDIHAYGIGSDRSVSPPGSPVVAPAKAALPQPQEPQLRGDDEGNDGPASANHIDDNLSPGVKQLVSLMMAIDPSTLKSNELELLRNAFVEGLDALDDAVSRADETTTLPDIM